MGNKDRLAKHITPYLTRHLTGENWYIETMAGAFGLISNIDYPKRIAYDKDQYIIELMRAVRDGWTPPKDVNENIYSMVRDANKKGTGAFGDAYTGFVGYGCSFGGKWWGGFARGGTSGGKERNHVHESIRNLEKMRPKLQGIKIQVCDYKDARLGEGNVILCDPPYSTGTGYKFKFDHKEFWEWVRIASVKNYVYVCEYNAPSDFVSVWSKEHKSGIDNKAVTHKKTIENLFTWDNQRSLVFKDLNKKLMS